MSDLLIPIRNFATVDESKLLYRSAQPEFGYEYLFLKNTLQVKTIINLRAEKDHDKSYCEAYGLTSITIPVIDDKAPTLEEAKQFMDFIKANTGILFHCAHGHGRTSLFCVLAKITFGMTLQDALKEETDKYGYTINHPEQVKFLTDNFS